MNQITFVGSFDELQKTSPVLSYYYSYVNGICTVNDAYCFKSPKNSTFTLSSATKMALIFAT